VGEPEPRTQRSEALPQRHIGRFWKPGEAVHGTAGEDETLEIVSDLRALSLPLRHTMSRPYHRHSAERSSLSVASKDWGAARSLHMYSIFEGRSRTHQG